MNGNKLYFTIVLTFLVLLLGFLSYEIFKPFLYAIAWAIVFAILGYPLFALLVRVTKRRSLSAFITLVVILLVIIGPALYLASILLHEVAALSSEFESGKINVVTDFSQLPIVRETITRVASMINSSEEQLVRSVMAYLSGIGREMAARIARGIGSIIKAFLGFLVMAITLYFMLRDAPAALGRVRNYLPFSDKQKDHLLKSSTDIIFSTMYGGIVVAVAQGIAGGLAFALLGISTPVVWGFVMAVFSLLPVVGPGMIWIPAAVYLFMQGAAAKGTAMVGTGIAIAAIDTFLRPVVVKNRVRMPFLIIFFSAIGGMQFFGFIGFILGPLVLALFFSVLDVMGSMNGSYPTGS